MSSVSPTQRVLSGFIAQANESYRRAGLSEYQMRLERDGTVSIPGAKAANAKRAQAAADQAEAGAAAAAPAAPTAGAAPATGSAPAASAAPAAGAKRTGPAPAISGLKPTKEGFELSWKPVDGAKQYGIWQDGTLVGHVSSPKFAGLLAAGSGGVLQVDAVLASGARTALTPAIRIARDAQGKLGVSDPAAAAAAAPAAATAPAAPAS